MQGAEVNFKMTILNIINEMRRNGILEIQGWSKKEQLENQERALGNWKYKHLKKQEKMLEFQKGEKKDKETEHRKQNIRKWESRLEQRKQYRGNDQREDVEKPLEWKDM